MSEQALGGMYGQQPNLNPNPNSNPKAALQCGWVTVDGEVGWAYISKGPECHTKKLLRKTQQKANE